MEFLSRKEYHKKKWKKIYTKENCPFCKKEQETIYKWKHWKIIYNISPYSWDDKHIMAIPNRHIVYSVELKEEEYKELLEIQKFVKNFFASENYFSFTRESMWNRSVEHLHIHFLAWKLKWKFLRKMLELQWFPIKEDLKI